MVVGLGIIAVTSDLGIDIQVVGIDIEHRNTRSREDYLHADCFYEAIELGTGEVKNVTKILTSEYSFAILITKVF